MREKIRVAHIADESNVFLNGNHFDNTTYDFHMKALKRNPRLELKYFDALEYFSNNLITLIAIKPLFSFNII